MSTELILSWLVTYWSHSLIALSGMWIASRWLRGRNLAVEEAGWKAAMFLTLVTASLQLGLTHGAGYRPLAGSFEFSTSDAMSLRERSSRQASTGVAEGAVGGPGASLAAEPSKYSNPDPADEKYRRDDSGLATGGGSTAAVGALSRFGGSSTLVLSIWMALMALLAARLVGSYFLLLKQLERRRVLIDGSFVSLLKRLRRRAGIVRNVRLSVCDRLSIPLALGLGRWEVCLPGRLAEEFGTEEQETVLAHELAHLVRRDAIWLLSARALAGALFFQPLNFLVFARLRELSELRSDDWAVAQTGRPITLARCLTRVASWRTHAWTNLPVPAMAGASRSQFGDRVRRLLSRSYPEPASAVPGSFKGALVLIGLVFVAAAPAAVRVQPEEGLAPPPVRKAIAAPRSLTAPALKPPALRGSTAAAPASPRPVLAPVASAFGSARFSATPVVAPLASARYAHLGEDGSFQGRDEPPGAPEAPKASRFQFGTDSDSDSGSESDPDSDSDSDSEDSDDPDRELEALEQSLESKIEAFEEAFEAEVEPVYEALEERLEESAEYLEDALEGIYAEFEDGLELDVEDALEEFESRMAEAESGAGHEAFGKVFAGHQRELRRFEHDQQRVLEEIRRGLERKLGDSWKRDIGRELERALEIYERSNEELPTSEELEEMRAELDRLRLELEPGLAIFEEMHVDFEHALEDWRRQYRADLGRHLREFRDRGDAAAPGHAEPEH